MERILLQLLTCFILSGSRTGTDQIISASDLTPSGATISELKAISRNGQVFLTWNEAETPEGTTFNVYVADKSIRNLVNARYAGHHIERHSARDWWLDKASFTKDTPADKPVGFLIESGGQRLDPLCGLFVYTLQKTEKKKLYFAVTCTDAKGKEERQIVIGTNSLKQGIRITPGPIQPIWQREGQPPEPGSGKGKALLLSLHGKSSVVPDMEYLVFGDESMGWRAGLPIKFSVRIQDGEVVIRPTDRVWINRPHLEAGDGGAPAIWTFWYGYNSLIYDRNLMSKGVPANYTEQILLWILGWVSEYYQPDPNRWYCTGSSMGGCGTISFGMHHQELFAALYAHVPIVSYTYLGTGSAKRLEPSCWIGTIPGDLNTNEGIPLLRRMNGIEFISDTKTDLPFLFLINGRRDASIPWENNPAFYEALSEAGQGFAAFWDNGEHATCGTDAPEDVKGWRESMYRFRLNESFPAFSNMSSDLNPGNGNPQNGDIIGWINRGIGWSDIEDTRYHYALTVIADFQDVQYPVQTDITLRRVQNFKPGAKERLMIHVGTGQDISIGVRSDGRIEVPGVVIPSKDGVRIEVIRAGSSL